MGVPPLRRELWAIVAFNDTLSEVGRDKLGDVIKAKQASKAACELQNRMKKESDTWLEDASRKVTGPVAYKHFEAILELIDQFDAQLID